jgi:hypothetical protein
LDRFLAPTFTLVAVVLAEIETVSVALLVLAVALFLVVTVRQTPGAAALGTTPTAAILRVTVVRVLLS